MESEGSFCCFAKYFWKPLGSKVVALSIFIDLGNPFFSMILFRNLSTALVMHVFVIFVHGHLLWLSTATRTCRFTVFGTVNGPRSSSWISSFIWPGTGSFFFSVDGKLDRRCIPEWKQTRHSAGFSSRSCYVPGQCTSSVSSIILC